MRAENGQWLRLAAYRQSKLSEQRIKIHWGENHWTRYADIESFASGMLGWVGKSKGSILQPAHPLEKSDASFMNTSIHRLSYWQVNIRKVGASSLKERSS
jgi:hypothetical protein